MDNRKVSKKQFEFLKCELDFYSEKELISGEQKESILNVYQVKQSITFVKVLLIVGAILVGLGVLSFIASNWSEISKLGRIIIILGVLVASNFVSYRLSENYPKTSRSFLYIGAAVFGAGIFLIGQTFNFGGHFTSAFLWWCLGVLPMAILFKDKIMFMLCIVLALTYLNGHFEMGEYPLWMILIIPVFYYCNKYFNYSKLITFFNNLLVLNTIAYILTKIDINGTVGILIFFAIGLFMYLIPVRFQKDVFRIQGNIIFGLSGFILTFSDVWHDLVRYLFYSEIPYYSYVDVYSRPISIVFSILFLLFLLILTRKGNIIPLIFVCFTIFKFYFDISYDFMPKALFFIIGGMLLIACGFYIEKTRRRLGGTVDEE